MKIKNILLLCCIFFICNCVSFAQVRLPQLISDGMVLQRDTKVNIWGWASPGEKVNVKFTGKNYNAVTGKDGKWKIVLSPMKAGGPYTMDIKASNHIVLNNILIGDVWFCSGQSNMVMFMGEVKEKYPEDVAHANYPQIRDFFVRNVANVSAVADDLPAGKWLEANPENVLTFGAASYFFAREIYNKYHIPIGLIHSSVGGTPIQAWISEEGLKEIPLYAAQVAQFKDTAYLNNVIRQQRSTQRSRMANASQTQLDMGLNRQTPWYAKEYVPEGWKPYWLPGYWEDQGIRNLHGVVWFRKEVNVPASMAGKPGNLHIGRIVDSDKVYINGVQVGESSSLYAQRRYSIAENILKAGKNLVVVRVTNIAGKGGFVPDKPYYLVVGKDSIDLRGDWQYKVGQAYPPVQGMRMNTDRFFSAQNEPTGLYNTMVAPVVNYAIKGALWYQGESNTSKPQEYGALMKALINDWRKQWNEPNLPVIYAQLPGFMETQYTPSESQWAELREEQLKTLSMPYTGMAVTIDIGEWNDVHPLDKKDVGIRLALAADNVAYGDKKVVPTGPLYQSAKLEGNHIIISFTSTGSGLMAKDGGDLAQFAIAGADKKYVWAKAVITGNQVSVSSDQIAHPMYVRYAWADNPDGANLYNKEGLPASPFEANLYDNMPQTAWYNRQCAVVLTYDDALDQHLDLVIPSLDSLGLKGTFYVIGSSQVLADRMPQWRQAARNGHELGNHTLFHPCDGSRPGRGFVTEDTDLSRYTLNRIVSEIKAANVLLNAIDGKTERTFAFTCGDRTVGDIYFYDDLKNDFVGARGVMAGIKTAGEVDVDNINCYMINGQSAEYMIDLVKQAQQKQALIVFLFHGVGGGHNINVTLSEHRKLVQYLKEQENQIWTTTMVEAAEKIRQVQSK